MNKKFATVMSIAVTAILSLSACSGGTNAGGANPDGLITLSLSGAEIQMAPGGELDTLVKGFEATHPKVRVEVKQYDSAQYTTLVSADLAAKAGTDLIWLNQVKSATTWIQGKQLLDVSDIEVSKDVKGLESYQSGGKTYALPYRFDSWVLYFNQDLFDKAQVAYPDGTWTWEDYEQKAADLSKGLKAAGSDAKAIYQHTWGQFDQAFPAAQVPGADMFSGHYEFMKPFYERSLRMQKAGDQIDYNTAKSNKLHYIPEFGKQQAAMFLMGSWYPQLLKADIAEGKSQKFKWGIAPAPQLNSETTGLDQVPVTVGDPTGIAINAGIDKSKLQAAKDFLQYQASEAGAEVLASAGVLPALLTDTVVKTWAEKSGSPSDDLSRFAVSTYKSGPDNPQEPTWPAIANILATTHDAIMSGAQTVDAALKEAGDRVKNEVGVK